jgi:hypothetical protein
MSNGLARSNMSSSTRAISLQTQDDLAVPAPANNGNNDRRVFSGLFHKTAHRSTNEWNLAASRPF